VLYHDGQFDDARLLISMVQTGYDAGACLLNYMRVTSLVRDEKQRISGVAVSDAESGQQFTVRGRAVINATGPFSDAIRSLDNENQKPMIAPSQGVHLVLPRELFPGDAAIIVPKTSDGRVIFVIPWHQHAIVGTTDTPIDQACLEPKPQAEEIEFLLATVGDYLERPPESQDVLGYFTGVRPLVKGDKSARTASLSRDHVIRISEHGLITIAGGKLTGYLKMAELVVQQVVQQHPVFRDRIPSALKWFPGASQPQPPEGLLTSLLDSENVDAQILKRLVRRYGDEAQAVLASGRELIAPGAKMILGQVYWAVTQEYAQTMEDVVYRRLRTPLYEPDLSVRGVERISELMAEMLGWDEAERLRQLDQIRSRLAADQHFLDNT